VGKVGRVKRSREAFGGGKTHVFCCEVLKGSSSVVGKVKSGRGVKRPSGERKLTFSAARRRRESRRL
jgi:hypothetical protein